MDIKTYQKKNKINKFSLIYIRSLNMIESYLSTQLFMLMILKMKS